MYYESELYHHGIKGQKWGKQNGPPYPLSRQEKNKISKKYEKYTKKANRYVDMSFNYINRKATEAANNKVGSDKKFKSSDWQEAYERMANQEITKLYSKNKWYKKAEELSKKYSMASWDDLAKVNTAKIKEIMEYQ